MLSLQRTAAYEQYYAYCHAEQMTHLKGIFNHVGSYMRTVTILSIIVARKLALQLQIPWNPSFPSSRLISGCKRNLFIVFKITGGHRAEQRDYLYSVCSDYMESSPGGHEDSLARGSITTIKDTINLNIMNNQLTSKTSRMHHVCALA